MLAKQRLLDKILENGVIAVIRKVPLEQIDQLAHSLIAGGVTALEVTVDHPDAYAAIQTLSRHFDGQAVIGAGTVLDAESAKLAIQHGAQFLLSPSLHPEVIRTALRYGKVAVPGVMTPTEIIQAVQLGADLVKVFPASALGVKYIKDVKSVFSHVPMIPTGGVDAENASAFVQAGAAAVGVGGNLINKQAMAEGKYEQITKLARQLVQTVSRAREEQR
ncbi:bifunctional 4-hydroxy-2-oxoglutarate aldolase/2-dehydro-3-deoxy-phosphogluconate aldolase [Brevibacillus fulvus]|uniref:2-dehydro-3-deoxyphosphogluconate aldolase/(4S)-4-hydroxy-2-oxoglutarate aldolase n=1 Tax=Brevibacillus fulvus TaxID=1125967 RepID=A0A938XZF4_9BACL|nr:bifunctional 4-hydroxy-2-oxoglutarate aldolase/2-dehydro-3-deoxy-phosphogluconate aldolase [Brevibacillus fulvus]MBM7589236.1 2-dehydro-3-deoxyphosphogluconate aldolase/(4S)-4-hydroxy-2-oxoglutarate aldolase [Brevibacillus fulvus]